jgi:hypothetical protein
MTSKEVHDILETKGVGELYKIFAKVFKIIDDWDTRLITGDLLNEYELSFAHDQMQGCYGKLYPIAGSISSYIEGKKANTKIVEHGKLEKYRPQDSTILNARAEESIKDLSGCYSDFERYAETAKQKSIGCQARLKRLSIYKDIKHIDRSGEVPVDTGKPTISGIWEQENFNNVKAWDE